jgi:glycosyltransferase involved in cell wall biosynthesis
MNLASRLAQTDPGKATEDFCVTVVTQTPRLEGDVSSRPPFQIVRKPSPWELWHLIGDADRVLLAGPAILPLAFALLRRRVLIVSHHGYQSICPNGMLFQFSTQACCPGHFAARRYLECIKCNTPQQGTTGSIRALTLTMVRRALSRLATSNVAVSDHVAKQIALPRLRVIRNGVPEVPSPQRVPSTPVPSRVPICFAYVGRLVTEKGIPILVEAAHLLKSRGCHFKVLIIGDGPERSALQALSTSLQLDNEVSFLGFQEGHQLQEAMNSVAALVMPSICEDAAPLSVLEQMMQERLIIGSRIGGLAEEIGNAGLTFEPGNATALAGQMQLVMQEPQLIERLSKLARQRALAYYTLQQQELEYRGLLGVS